MKRSRFTLVVLLLAWLGSLGAVYILGLFSAFAFHRAPGAGGLEGVSPHDRAYIVLVERLLDQPVQWTELKSNDAETAVPAQVASLVVELSRQPDAERRAIAAETIAAVYPSRKIVPAIQRLLVQLRTPGRDALLTALFHRWGRIDGRSALDFTLTALPDNTLTNDLVRAALAGFAEDRPEMAWQWVRQHSTGVGSEQPARFATVLAAAGTLPDERVAEWLAGLNDPVLAEQVAGREAVRRLSTEGVRAAFAFAEAVTTDYAGRTAVLSELVVAWTGQDLPTVLRWFEGLDPDTRGWALTPIAASWSARDGEAALRWLGEAPPLPVRDNAVRVAALNWLEQAGPAPLGRFLNGTQNLSVYSPAIEMLALETMSIDPETAFSWSGLIEEPSRRRFVAATIASYWLAEAPRAAEAALRERGMILSGQTAESAQVATGTIPSDTAPAVDAAPGETAEEGTDATESLVPAEAPTE